MTKPFLKWAGGKSRLVATIEPLLQGQRLIEPFAGSCALFLGSQFKHALLADLNEDLIALYTLLQQDDALAFIDYAQTFFTPECNTQEQYTALRARFNALPIGDRERAALFVYLNRHAFNGICRYNRSGLFNVPYGKYKGPGFPKDAMTAFVTRVKDCVFVHQGYIDTFQNAGSGDVIYADPPYAPLSLTASFSAYAKEGFAWSDHQELARQAVEATRRGARVVISNHATPAILDLYTEHGGDCSRLLEVRRSVSAQKESRGTAGEVLAVFNPA